MVDIIDNKLKYADDVCKYLESKYERLKREHIYIIGIQDKIVKLTKDISFNNRKDNADFNFDEMYNMLNMYDCDSFIFSHNHPNNYPLPSKVDIKLTKKMIKNNDIQNIKLIEHFVYSHILLWPILKNTLKMEMKL